MSRVFFVLPVYNVKDYLERAVHSVVHQTYADTYIVLVDDGSTDGSGALCDMLAAGFRHVEVLHKQNGGLSDARNAGIRRCVQLGKNDDYICLLDSDDFVREDFAERLVSLCRENGCRMAQCAYEKGSANGFSAERTPGAPMICTGSEALLGYRLKTPVTNKIFRLDILAGEQFPVGRWNEDEFFLYRAAYRCEKIAFTDEKLYYYYQRPGSIMDDIAKKLKDSPRRYDWLYAYTERIIFFKEKGEREQVLRTCEKICTDIILRHTEQLRLPKEERDPAVANGEYLRTYRNFCRIMLRRPGIPAGRRLMYRAFALCPRLARFAERFTPLRK